MCLERVCMFPNTLACPHVLRLAAGEHAVEHVVEHAVEHVVEHVVEYAVERACFLVAG